MVWLHAEEGHAMLAVSQALPWLGIVEGHGDVVVGTALQNQTGVPMG
jgi:hypothetical protein